MRRSHKISEANEKQAREGLEDEDVAGEFRGGRVSRATSSSRETIRLPQSAAALGGQRFTGPEGECSMLKSRIGFADARRVSRNEVRQICPARRTSGLPDCGRIAGCLNSRVASHRRNGQRLHTHALPPVNAIRL